MKRSGYSILGLALLIASGCGRSSGPGAEAVRAPATAGEVWEIDRAAGRPAMPGAVLAYLNGLHVIVLDGKAAFAGMTRLEGESKPDGARAFKLASGLEATLSPSAQDQLELRFSSGESIGMRKKK